MIKHLISLLKTGVPQKLYNEAIHPHIALELGNRAAQRLDEALVSRGDVCYLLPGPTVDELYHAVLAAAAMDALGV